MKIIGNETTIKFFADAGKPDEIPMLKRLGSKLGPYCGSFCDFDENNQPTGKNAGIEISTKALFQIVEERPGIPKI